MTIRTPEIATAYGCLDTSAAGDGGAMHAHTLRELAKNSNRLIARGGPLLQLVFDASEDATGEISEGALKGFGLARWWQRIYWGPIVAPKKPTHTTAAIQVICKIEYGLGLDLYVHTSAEPFRREIEATSPHILSMVGDGSGNYQTFSASGIPLGDGSTEQISLFLRAQTHSGLAPSGTVGTNAGTLSAAGDSVGEHTLVDAGAAFQAAIAGNGYMLIFTDPTSGAPLAAPRNITYFASTTEIDFTPSLSVHELSLCTGAAYEVHERYTWRIANLALYTEDLTP